MGGFIMSTRRKFIQTAFYGGVGLVGLSSFDWFALKDDVVKLTVLHTNDMHSHIEPFPANDPKYPGQGGMARRASLVKKIRQEETNVLLLDAGDIFQGTPYFNKYGGELEFKLMSAMGYDAATMGNHDFDNGIDGFVRMLPHAAFPFICSNYDFTNTALHGKTKPYHIIEKDGIKIGLFGIGIELDGLVDQKLYGETIYNDPLQVASKYAKLLRADLGCHLVICLSHLGYRYKGAKVSDEILAKRTENIDLIIGGHTHTFLDEPIAYRNSKGKKVLVNQVGWAGLHLGRIDYYFKRGVLNKSVGETGFLITKNYAKI